MKHRIIALFCAAVLLLLLPGCGEKAAEEPNFDGYKIYELTTSLTRSEEDPYWINGIIIAPYDATWSDIEKHTEYTAGALGKAFPSLHGVSFDYYESILFYKSMDTPIGHMRWERQEKKDPADLGYQVYGSYHKLNDYWMLTEEERALYAQLQEYFLEELGIPLVSGYDFSEEEIAGFEKAAEALGHTNEELMALTEKQGEWRPPDWYD